MGTSSPELQALESFALGILQNNPLQSNELIQLSLKGKVDILPELTREELIHAIANKAGGILDHSVKVEYLTRRFTDLVYTAYRNRLTTTSF